MRRLKAVNPIAQGEADLAGEALGLSLANRSRSSPPRVPSARCFARTPSTLEFKLQLAGGRLKPGLQRQSLSLFSTARSKCVMFARTPSRLGFNRRARRKHSRAV